MGNNDSWFERNAGLLNTLGHLAAISQRRDIIDQQRAQAASLNYQESLLEKQLQKQRELADLENRKQEKEAQEKELIDLLFEVGERCTEISDHYATNSKMALYESIMLHRHVRVLGLNHRCFSSLEWKTYCDQSLKTVESLLQYAPNVLTESEIAEVKVRIREEDRIREEEQRAAEQERVARARQTQLIQEEKRTKMLLMERRKRKRRIIGVSIFAVVLAIVGWDLFITNNRDATEDVTPVTINNDTATPQFPSLASETTPLPHITIPRTVDVTGAYPGDVIKLSGDTPIYFQDNVYAKGHMGEKQTVTQYSPETHKVYFTHTDENGHQITLNVADKEAQVSSFYCIELYNQAIAAWHEGHQEDALGLFQTAELGIPKDKPDLKQALDNLIVEVRGFIDIYQDALRNPDQNHLEAAKAQSAQVIAAFQLIDDMNSVSKQ